MELEFKELKVVKDAQFSKDGKHRFLLTRTWDESKGLVMFIGLNPSTANQEHDDPTIRRVIRFAKDWGYGGVVMANLFTMVTAYPKELDPNRFTDLADWIIREEAEKCEKVICAWGGFKIAKMRGLEVMTWLGESYALQINSDGSPIHPLYVRADIEPVKFNP